MSSFVSDQFALLIGQAMVNRPAEMEVEVQFNDTKLLEDRLITR